ncbi:MAG: PilN domain-containing protein [Desulfovermiculus sp.]
MRTRLSRLFTGMHRVLWAFPDRIVVHRTTAAPWLRAVLPVSKQEYPRPGGMGLANDVSSVLHALPCAKGDKWHVGLPLEYFTLVNFNLPLAAQENLAQAVQYALMRHVPFDVASTYTAYRLMGANSQLEIAAVVAQRADVDPVSKVFTNLGLQVQSIFPGLVLWALSCGDGAYLLHAAGQTGLVVSQEGKVPCHLWSSSSIREDEEAFLRRGATLVENIPEKPKTLYVIGPDAEQMPGLNLFSAVFEHTQRMHNPPFVSAKDVNAAPYTRSLLSDADRRQERIGRILRLAACAFVLLSLVAFPLADILGTVGYKSRLQDKLDSVHSQVRELEAIRNQNQELVTFFDVLAQEVQSAPRAGIILKEMSEVVPVTAWLYSYHFSPEEVRIQGQAKSATAVLEALENSVMFADVRFDSPVQKSGEQDRFTIVARVSL